MFKPMFLIVAAFVFVGCSHQAAQVTPEPPIENPVVKPTSKPCVTAGCSSQLCVDEKDQGIVTTCEFKPEYGCRQQATCERQKSGSCGWTETAASEACFEDLAKKEQAAKAPAPEPAPVARAPQTFNVNIAGFAFSHPTLNVQVGDTVVWTQVDGTPHTVTSDTGTELQSALLSSGQTYSHTFTQTGTFPYHCAPHPSMKGTVVVK